ncbi:MAG: ribose-phosphate pyrophosphokinase [Planctomycetota bacterium]
MNQLRQRRFGELQVIDGGANSSLSVDVAKACGVELTKCYVSRFPDGESDVRVDDDVRGNDVFVVQSTCTPVNDHLMDLLLILDALKRASAGRVTAVMPYYGYARKDRKDEGRVPISSKLVANMIVAAGADRVLALELHAAQIQGFFDIPMDHLYAAPVFVDHFTEKGIVEPVIVAPDVGGIKLARAYAKRLGGSLAIVDKRRVDPGEAKAMHLIGEVEGRDVILMDDMIATGGTMAEAVRVVRDAGCGKVFLAATHGVFAGPAVERFRELPAEEIAVTDSIPQRAAVQEFATVLSVGPLLGQAIHRIHESLSVSSLFVD